MKKLVTSVFLSVILIIATVGFVSSAEGDLSYEKQVNAEQTEKQLAEELRTYGGITKAEFDARREVMAKSGSILSDFHDRYTEDQYGGMWYDDEGYLNIYLLEESKALQTKGLNSKAKIDEQKALVNNENVKIHTAKYSLTELNKAKEELSEIIDPNTDLFFYYAFGVDESLNRVEIELPASFGYDTKPEVVALRKQIESMDTVVITYSEEVDTNPEEYMPRLGGKFTLVDEAEIPDGVRESLIPYLTAYEPYNKLPVNDSEVEDKKHDAGIPQSWSGPAVRDVEDPELAAKIMAEIEGSAMDVSVAPFEDNATYDRGPVDVTEIVDNSMKMSITPLAVNKDISKIAI